MIKLVFIVLTWVVLLCTHARGSSIVLLSPSDNSEDINPYPVFCWVFVPGNLTGMTLKYTFKVAEYDVGLGEAGSLSANLIFSEEINDNNDNVCYQYPGTATALEGCSTYVWQVFVESITMSETEPPEPVETLQATSEIYSFGTYCESDPPSSDPNAPNTVYMVPKKRPDNFVYLITGDSLHIKYDEIYTNDSIEYKIVGENNTTVENAILYIDYGLNYVSIPIDGLEIDESSTEYPKIYRLELYLPKKETLHLKFEKTED